MLHVNMKQFTHTIDITSEHEGEIQDRWIFSLQFSTPEEAAKCKNVWSHLARSFKVKPLHPAHRFHMTTNACTPLGLLYYSHLLTFTHSQTMSPSRVTYVNVPPRNRSTTEQLASQSTDQGHQPFEIIIPGFRNLRLTGHLASPHFQDLMADLLGQPKSRRAQPGGGEEGEEEGEEEREEEGRSSRAPGSTITSSDVHGVERGLKSGQRGVRKTAKTAQRNAARQAARQEHVTNPPAAQARRSERVARRAAVNYSEDAYFEALQGLFD